MTSSGLNATPVVSVAGSNTVHATFGSFKFSHDGTRLASTTHNANACELLDFDNGSGVVSDPTPILITSTRPYGVEFSPNDDVLYLSDMTDCDIVYQLDLTSGSAATINASKITLGTSGGSDDGGTLKLGPDGKIYMARKQKGSIGVISNSDVLGAGANFVAAGFTLVNNKKSKLGLPNFVTKVVCTPLPVGLSSFEATCERDKIVLNWETVTEQNNDYFVLEKSFDGSHFTEFSVVEGAGNSTEIQYYSEVDQDVEYKTTYYRLKQVDFDGQETSFDVISQRCNSEELMLDQLVFNQQSLSFELLSSGQDNVTICLFDASGRLIAQATESLKKGNNPVYLNCPNLESGMYLMSIIGNNGSLSTKLMNRQ